LPRLGNGKDFKILKPPFFVFIDKSMEFLIAIIMTTIKFVEILNATLLNNHLLVNAHISTT
jgi:hypothetical protein